MVVEQRGIKMLGDYIMVKYNIKGYIQLAYKVSYFQSQLQTQLDCSIMSRISVYVRLRPLLQNQADEDSVKRRIHMDQTRNEISVELTQKRQKVFKFDRIITDDTTQQQVYDSIDMDGLINRVVEGFHSTIFAYGQTGSGKTYTIEGQDHEEKGLIPRSIKNLFRMLKEKEASTPGLSFRVHISFLQIYNQQIYDLIDVNKKPLKMRWNKYQQFLVEDLFEGQCRDEQEALSWWLKGQKSKIIDSHNMNKESSRSHCILTLKVRAEELQDPSNSIQSKLQIVDLAGSERQKVTKSTGIVFREGIQINKSLFSLRQVIAALYESNTGSKAQALPPYRDSKLTSLLKQSIGGNAYCAMIACINPTLTHFQQSLQTLTYASMATYINNSPSRNVDPKIKENEVLKEQNTNLKEEIRKLSAHIQYLTNLLQKSTCQKCGSANAVKLDGMDEKLIRSTQKLNTETDIPEGIKLPKFSNAYDPKMGKSSTLTQSVLGQTQSKYFKKRPESKQKSFTMQQTPKGNYQLKNPKEILESITMIRDLINTNTKLRDKIEIMRDQYQRMEKETFQVIQENQLLRERWDMLGSNLKVETEHADSNEAPISLYQRLLKQQKGETLVYLPNAEKSASFMESKQKNQKVVELRSIRREANTEFVGEQPNFQSLRNYRPYNEIFKSGSKKKKDSVHGRKRNVSNMKEKSESFIY